MDVVLGAAWFRVNAEGSHELSLGAGFGQRQLLKASGAYLAERVALGVTALHVHALVSGCGRWTRRGATWPRADVRCDLVEARGCRPEDLWPAVRLTDCGRSVLAELKLEQCDDEAWNVLTMLLRISA